MSESSAPDASGGQRRTGWAELATGEHVKLARPLRRLGARLLDGLLIAVGLTVVPILFFGGLVASGAEGEAAVGIGFVGLLLVALIAGIGYEVTLTALWGQTLGKRMTGIKVINAANGGVPGWGKSLGRWAIPGLIPALIPFIGPFVAFGGVMRA